jgi:hypothetical protein
VSISDVKVYDGVAWVSIKGPQGEPGADGGGTFTASTTAPSTPTAGDRWLETDTGIEYVYFSDGSSSQWVETGNGGSGPQGATGADGSDGTNGTDGLGFDGITSTSSVAIGTGSKSFALNKIGALVVGTRVRVVSTANTANYVEGTITGVSTLTITVNVDNLGGSGTIASWNVTVAGVKGDQGDQGDPGADGAVGPTGPAGGVLARAVLSSAVTTNGTTNATTVASYSIGAGTVAVGTTYRIAAKGYRTGTNNSGGTFAVSIGGQTVTTLTHANSGTAAGWSVDALVTIRSTGSSGTAAGQESLVYNATWLTTSNNSTVTVDTTGAMTLSLVMTAANVNNSYLATQCVIEQVN